MFKISKLIKCIFPNFKYFIFVVFIILLYLSIIFEWHRDITLYVRTFYISHISNEAEIAQLALSTNWQNAIARDKNTSKIVLESIVTNLNESQIISKDHDTKFIEKQIKERKDTFISIVKHKNTNDYLLEKIKVYIDNINNSSSCDIRSSILERDDLNQSILVALSKEQDCGCDYLIKAIRHNNFPESNKENVLNTLIPSLNNYLEIHIENKEKLNCLNSALKELDIIDSGNRETSFKDIKTLVDLYSFYQKRYKDLCDKDIQYNKKLCLEYDQLVENGTFDNTNVDFKFIYKNN